MDKLADIKLTDPYFRGGGAGCWLGEFLISASSRVVNMEGVGLLGYHRDILTGTDGGCLAG